MLVAEKSVIDGANVHQHLEKIAGSNFIRYCLVDHIVLFNSSKRYR